MHLLCTLSSKPLITDKKGRPLQTSANGSVCPDNLLNSPKTTKIYLEYVELAAKRN